MIEREPANEPANNASGGLVAARFETLAEYYLLLRTDAGRLPARLQELSPEERSSLLGHIQTAVSSMMKEISFKLENKDDPSVDYMMRWLNLLVRLKSIVPERLSGDASSLWKASIALKSIRAWLSSNHQGRSFGEHVE